MAPIGTDSTQQKIWTLAHEIIAQPELERLKIC